MRKVDIAHYFQLLISDENTKKLESFPGKPLNKSELNRILKESTQVDYRINVVIYPEVDIGYPPLLFDIVSGGGK